MSNIHISSSDIDLSLPDNSVAKIFRYKNSIEVVTSQSSTSGAKALSKVRRYSKEEYIDTETGEVLKYNRSTDKADNTDAIKQSVKRIRRLILNNFTEFESVYVTLTYDYLMRDFNGAINDFNRFLNKLKYHFGSKRFEYLRIIEPQETGSWHFHLLLKSSENGEYIRLSKDDITNLWGHGSVKLSQIYDVEGLAVYLGTFCKSSDSGGRKSKMQLKSSRWKYYPVGARIYSKSNGIVYPQSEVTTKGEATKRLENSELLSVKSVIVSDADSGKIVNRVTYETYRK